MATSSGSPRSATISFAEFLDAYQALAFANCQGFLVDTALDVTWSLQGIFDSDDVARANANLLDGITRWLTDRGLPSFYIWAIEEGATFGLHSHITLHLPSRLRTAFEAAVEDLLVKVSGRPLIATAESRTRLMQVHDSETSFHQWRRFRYTCKSLDPAVGASGLQVASGTVTLAQIANISFVFGGFMAIQRIGVAPALAAAARAHWAERIALPDMDVRPDQPPVFDDRYIDWHRRHHAELSRLGLLLHRQA